jgi:Concanavalin A-like lectin/glucanases superfamily/Bacterial Ig-like domain/Calcineurin-like phosphoesterase
LRQRRRDRSRIREARAFLISLLAVLGVLAVGSNAPGQTGSAYANAVLADGPTGYWRLGETTGTAAADSSPSGIAGAYLNGVVKGVAGALSGESNTAARFDGSNDRVNMGDPGSGALDVGTSDFTVEAWLKTTTPADDTYAGKKPSGNSGAWWHLAVTDDAGHVGQLRATIKVPSGTRTVYSTGRVDDGAWHHTVVRFDRDVGIDFFVDGAPSGSTAGATAGSITSAVDFLLGRAGGLPHFAGDIDEVAFYRSLLPAARIATHYQTGILDTTAPTITLTSPGNGGSVSDTTPSFAGTAGTAPGDSTTVTVRVYDGTAATGTPLQTLTATRGGGGAYMVDATSALALGTYTAQAEQSDGVGNVGTSSANTFTVVAPPPDTTPPAVTLTTPGHGSSGSDTTPTFAGAAGTAAGDSTTVTVKVYAGTGTSGTLLQTRTANASAGTYSVDASPELALGTYTARAEQSDDAGNTGLSSANTFTVTSPPPPGDPILIGAGDIASCGDSEFTGHEETADILDQFPTATVFTAGDNVYINGTSNEFAQCYDPNWGRSKNRTRPATGNHDYGTNDATGYFGYFGARAGDPTKGYYSYDLGSWHIIALNSQCSDIDGCGVGSPQEQWLRADLLAHQNVCTLAYWHYPRFNSGDVHGESFAPYVLPFWNALYENGADVIVSAHEHLYERFLPQRPDRTLDLQYGIAQFTIGTGGYYFYDWGQIKPNSAARNNTNYGVIKFTLHPTSYDFEFVPIAGQTYNDRGSASCHGAPGGAPDTTPPVISLTSPAGGSTTTDTTPNFAGVAGLAAGDSTTVTVKVYSGTSASGTPVQTRTVTRAGDGSYSVDAAPALPLGTYTAQAEQLDSAANMGFSGANTFTIEAGPPPPPDTTPPVVTVDFPHENTVTSDTTPTVSGTGGTVAGDSTTVTLKLYEGNGTTGPLVRTIETIRAPGGAWSVDVSPALPLGSYTAQAQQADDAGNIGVSNTTFFTIVPPPPAPPYVTEVLNDNPRSYWRLGETSGTAAADERGANPGTYQGGVTLGALGALANDANKAAHFDGVDDQVNMGDPANGSLDFGTADFTVEAWVKTTVNGERTIFAKKAATGNYWQATVTDDGGHAGEVRVYLNAGGPLVTAYGRGKPVDNGAWHHVVIAFDRGVSITIYVDGVATTTAATGTADVGNSGPFQVGKTDAYAYFSGDIDEVAVYPTLLSAARVQAHLAAGRG